MKSGLPLYDAAEAAIAAFYAHAGETFQAIDCLEDMVEVVRGLQQCQRRLIHIRRRAERGVKRILRGVT